VKATDALILSQVVLSLGLPVPMISLLLLTSDRRVMGSFTNTRITYALAMGVILLVIGLNTVLVLQTAGIPIV
jgi:manganese transport protein